jgi:hypothetical protein
VSPYASVSLPTLVPLQRYDISLRLTIPATETNYALGNFMTSLTLTTPSNKTLASVRRPVSLCHSASNLSLITITDYRVSPTTLIFPQTTEDAQSYDTNDAVLYPENVECCCSRGNWAS